MVHICIDHTNRTHLYTRTHTQTHTHCKIDDQGMRNSQYSYRPYTSYTFVHTTIQIVHICTIQMVHICIDHTNRTHLHTRTHTQTHTHCKIDVQGMRNSQYSYRPYTSYAFVHTTIQMVHICTIQMVHICTIQMVHICIDHTNRTHLYTNCTHLYTRTHTHTHTHTSSLLHLECHCFNLKFQIHGLVL